MTFRFPLAEHWSSYYCEHICLQKTLTSFTVEPFNIYFEDLMWLFTHLWRLDKQDRRLKISLSWHFTSSLKLLSNWTFLSEHVDCVVFALNRFVNCVDRVVFASNRVVGSRRKSLRQSRRSRRFCVKSRRWIAPQIASLDRVVGSRRKSRCQIASLDRVVRSRRQSRR